MFPTSSGRCIAANSSSSELRGKYRGRRDLYTTCNTAKGNSEEEVYVTRERREGEQIFK